MKIAEIINKPEGRRLEFKENMPSRADLARTVVAFANDSGGDIYLGIRNNPREITGLPDKELVELEEQISNLIYSRCSPGIIPDISFLSVDDKHLIKITIYRGNMPPYYLKEKGKLEGTYIRVGSANRLADLSIIEELERKKRNISYDGEILTDKQAIQLSAGSFQSFYLEKTGEAPGIQEMKILELIKEDQGVLWPTNAYVLFSDDELRRKYFNFAKVECARFKGTGSEEFIDQKSIQSNIALQAEEAYNFVLRHINKGAFVQGVYTQSRWEYPVVAIREVIRNAVVHRDYSLKGKDIKIAVYDDMVEITSPGLLPPSIDYNEMESRQSDARNRVIAPVFKLLGIIDQWGNGLKLIADELKEYPEIEFRWRETGLSFQVQFVKRYFKADAEKKQELGQELEQELGQELEQELRQERKEKTMFSSILIELSKNALSRQQLAQVFGLKKVSGHLNRTLAKLYDNRLIEHTIPEKKNHPDQMFRITERGLAFLQLVAKSDDK